MYCMPIAPPIRFTRALTINGLLYLLLLFGNCTSQHTANNNAYCETADIANFWNAYDSITSTTDTARQRAYLQTLFLDQGTPGLAAIMQARRYTADSYLEGIRSYPKFWASVRPNMQKAGALASSIGKGVEQLKAVYPILKPAKVYFTVGAFRTNGTTMDSLVLIGSELAMADPATVSTEFPENMGHLPAYFASNPIENLVFLNVHEYVHTQQNAPGGYDLLSQCVFEGVAEFVPVIATGQASPNACIAYGKANADAVRAQFEKELFSRYAFQWVWNDTDNQFGTRDLGYYVGYAMAELHYNKAENKQQAIKELIELDYTSREAIEAFVEQTGYFEVPLAELRAAYLAGRPQVVKVTGIENGGTDVPAGAAELRLDFSEPMDYRIWSTQGGSMGDAGIPKIINWGIAVDGMSCTYEFELEAGKQYELLFDGGVSAFGAREMKALSMKFETSEE